MRSILLFGVLYCRTLDYSSSHSADTDILINCFLSITTTRYCFAYGFYNIAGLKGQTDILVSFIMPLLIILRASPLCRIARYVRRMRELSSGPEAHLFRTPGSPLAERIHPVRCSTRAFSPSGARGECRNEAQGQPALARKTEAIPCRLDFVVVRCLCYSIP